MVITEPAVPIPIHATHAQQEFYSIRGEDQDLFLSTPKMSKWKKSSASRVIFWQLPFQISNRRFTDDFDSISCYTVCKD